MKISRTLATAVAAVTTPALLLSVTPAFADGKPAAQTEKKPTIAELEKAAADAQKAYDKAVADESDARKALADLDSAPAMVALKNAQKDADEAARVKAAADQELTDAKTWQNALPATAGPVDKDLAAQRVAKAEAAVTAADTANATAAGKLATAKKAADQVQNAAKAELERAKGTKAKALADKQAADKALADAKAAGGEGGAGGQGGKCPQDMALTAVLNGFPSQIAAGSSADFSVRVTNGTGKQLDRLWPFVYAYVNGKGGGKDIDKLVHLQWSDAGSNGWKDLPLNQAGPVTNLAAGKSADVKLRLKVDGSTPVGRADLFVAADYRNADGTCGGTPSQARYEFDVLAVGAKPTKTGESKPTTAPRPQGGAAATPLSATAAAPKSGALAETGSSSALPQLALSGGAVVLGAGAIALVRRRKAAQH
ncbi:peptidase [Streptomyces sp. NBC_00212]|uniref:peptidase n=1 Tax=Streptomyces sp. NBC_00212 TaxID=2975684 RepID=UPI0032440D49